MNILELSEQEIVRRNNLQQLRDLGIDPYPAAAYPTDAFSTEIKENFVDLPTIKKFCRINVCCVFYINLWSIT